MSRYPVTVSYLRYSGEAPAADSFTSDFSLVRHEGAAPSLYRRLYYEVGERQLWWERRLWSESHWQAIADNPKIELWVLYEGDVMAGYFELNYDALPSLAELAFFGLYPNYIGRGLGRKLLRYALRELCGKSPQTIEVNTCDWDHAAALPLYESVGFRVHRKEVRTVEDPRATGLLAESLPLPDSYTGSPT